MDDHYALIWYDGPMVPDDLLMFINKKYREGWKYVEGFSHATPRYNENTGTYGVTALFERMGK